MIVKIKEEVVADAKELRLYLKVSDMFTCGLYDTEGKELKDYDGYVPDFMPGQHYGDYVILNIDVNTGQITNWESPKVEDIEKFINDEEDD